MFDWLRFWKRRGANARPADGALYPECLIVVVTTEHAIEVTRPDGQVERIAMADLGEVRIDTDDTGPGGDDFRWVLIERSSGEVCTFPLGASGEDAAIARLQRLPGFDNEAYGQAIRSTSVAQFSCWKAGR